ncbi:MAG: hypothetical protein ACREQQ_11500 [Candidatus Binatia bacterium]
MSAFLIYAAGLLLIAFVAWMVASPWWTEVASASAAAAVPSGDSRWRKQKDEALSAIKDAEFDFQLGKLSEPDYRQLRARLETEALEAMTVLEKGRHGNA